MEIRRSLDFYNSTASDDRISGVYVSGGCSKVYNLINTISEQVGLPVERLNPFAKLKYNENDFDPEYLEEIGPFMAVPASRPMHRWTISRALTTSTAVPLPPSQRSSRRGGSTWPRAINSAVQSATKPR